ncbi:MAG: hypothetical protein V3S55_09810 [Nitrospiraceae bacterium]
MEETFTAATATIAFMLSKHQAALGTRNQYAAAVTEDAEDDADILISDLVCHPAVTVFANGSVANTFLMHLNKQATP